MDDLTDYIRNIGNIRVILIKQHPESQRGDNKLSIKGFDLMTLSSMAYPSEYTYPSIKFYT